MRARHGPSPRRRASCLALRCSRRRRHQLWWRLVDDSGSKTFRALIRAASNDPVTESTSRFPVLENGEAVGWNLLLFERECVSMHDLACGIVSQDVAYVQRVASLQPGSSRMLASASMDTISHCNCSLSLGVFTSSMTR